MFMKTSRMILGGLAGLLSVIGGIALLWGSQDAMLVLIHWLGEEWALGKHNVIRRPDGSTLVTNPTSMAKWMSIIWVIGASQIVAGASLLFRCGWRPRKPSVS